MLKNIGISGNVKLGTYFGSMDIVDTYKRQR